jgi:lambda family phage portal protein
MGMVPESGEALVRYRPRRVEDKLPLPFQLQLLEGDYLDTSKNGQAENGNVNISGVEFDLIGRRSAYWMFPVHPGAHVAGLSTLSTAQRIDSRFVAHIHRIERDAEEVRGMTWYAPVILRMRDFADFIDAQLMRQKIAACFSVFITDNGEFSPTVADADPADADEAYPIEAVEPGMIHHLKAGESVEFGNPPGVGDLSAYSAITLREIAMGLGITYEALTGDLTGVNYSSGRMGWLEYQRNIDAWRWTMFIPQFLDRLTEWTNDAVKMKFGPSTPDVVIDWTPPRREMIDPATELEAAGKAIRMGLSSRSEEIRTLGRDPEQVDSEIAADNERADRLKLTLDSDPRQTDEAGKARMVAQPAPDPTAQAVKAQMDLFATVLAREPVQPIINVAAPDISVTTPAVTVNPEVVIPDRLVIDAVKAVGATRSTIRDTDDQGRIKTMVVEPVAGSGPRYLRTFIHDAKGRAVGHEDTLIEEPTDG